MPSPSTLSPQNAGSGAIPLKNWNCNSSLAFVRPQLSSSVGGFRKAWWHRGVHCTVQYTVHCTVHCSTLYSTLIKSEGKGPNCFLPFIHNITVLGKGAKKNEKKTINDGFMYVFAAEKCEMMVFRIFFYRSFYRQFSAVAREKTKNDGFLCMYVCVKQNPSLMDLILGKSQKKSDSILF